MSCTKCSLSNVCTKVKVDSVIKDEADILIVVDAPDRDDDRRGSILSGDTGKKLLWLLHEAGIPLSRVSMSSAVRCKPKNLSDIKKVHLDACRDYLFEEIVTVKPKIIITAGRYSFETLTNHTSIIEFRGHFGEKLELEYPEAITNKIRKLNIPILPTFSIAGSMAKWEYHDYIINDFKKALKYVDTGIIDKTIVPVFTLVDSIEKLNDFKNYMLNNVKYCATDFETTGFAFFKDKIINAGYCTNDDKIFIVPITPYSKEHTKKWKSEDIRLASSINRFLKENRSKIFNTLKEIHSSNIKWVLHNGKFDQKFARANDFKFNNFYFDTLMADSLVDENKIHMLNHCLEIRGINFGAYDVNLWPYVGKKSNKSYQYIPVGILNEYLARDVYGTKLLFKMQYKELEKENLLNHMLDRKMKILKIMIDVEYAGVKADRKLIIETENLLKEKIKELEIQAIKITKKKDFNMGSPKQLQEYMIEAGFPFEKLDIKKTKSGYSTGKVELQKFMKYKKWATFPTIVLTHKSLSKLAGTYVGGKVSRKESDDAGGFLQYLDHRDRIHANFNLWSPRTSRFSCNKPSLQVWPRPVKGLPNIRNFLVPTNEDWVLWEADYKQLEQCVVAVLSSDKTLIYLIRTGTDLHCDNAVSMGKILGTLDSDITYEYMMVAVGKGEEIGSKIDPNSISDNRKAMLKEKRNHAKGLGFGINYGKSAKTFSEEFGISIESAEDMVNAYFRKYKGMKKWRDNTVEQALTEGYVELESGRKRRFYQAVNWINSKYSEGTWGAKKLSEEIARQAMNFPVQGGAHEIFEPANIRLMERIKKEGLKSRLLLSIHDGIVGECPRSEIEIMNQILKEELTYTVNKGTELELTFNVDIGFFDDRWYGKHLEINK